MRKPIPELPDIHHSATLKRGVKLSLSQAKLPEPLHKAVKAQLQADGLTWRQIFRWAALQYLARRNEERARQIWSKCV